MNSQYLDEACQVMGGDIPLLINIVSKRTRHLDKGASALIPVHPRWGLTDIALQEIIQGKVKAGSVEHVLEF